MARRGRDWLPIGCEQVFPVSMPSAVETKTSSMPPLSPSTAKWIPADQIPWEDYQPEVESKTYKWSIFPEWHEWSLCRGMDPKSADEMFFGESEDESKTTMTVSKLREVKKFCLSCPVWETCLRHALSNPERHGVWAGTSKRTRLRILVLIESGDTTIDQVVDDYQSGRERKYESIRYQG